jgi:tetratricopeptide (TPR) repeat protein
MISLRRGIRRVAGSIALLVTLAPAVNADIPLALRFNGEPLTVTATPEFTCFSYNENRWLNCEARRAQQPGDYSLASLPPGKYRLHVSIDENPANPRLFPGDYEAQKIFEVTPEGPPPRLEVDVPRLLHLTRPGDNARPIDGMLTGCATQPRFETARVVWTPRAKIDFGWEPVAEGAEYRYSLFALPCTAAGALRKLIDDKTLQATLVLDLPPLPDNEYYQFRVEAWKDGRMVGDLYTHDSGAHSWNYRFRIVDNSVPRWAYFAGAGLVLLVFLMLRKTFGGLPAQTRRDRLRRFMRGGIVVLILGAIAAGGYAYYHAQQRKAQEQASAAVEAERAAKNQEFISAFTASAPKPDWWDKVETPYRVQSYGDLMAAWQGYPRDEKQRVSGERQFFKAAYQGILDHPDDLHIVVTAIQFLHYVVSDYPQRIGLAEFGVNRYFGYRQRTDNCANCMPGDTVQSLTHNLSQLYSAANRYNEAIAINQRLIDERGKDVSPYKLAETWNQIAWAYWHAGKQERAIGVVREALGKYRDTVRGDDLARSLERFEKDSRRQ